MLIYSLKPVKGKKKLADIFSNAFKFYEHDAALFVCFASSRNAEIISGADKKTIGYVVTVKKRNAKKAVVRNRIKRLLRESLKVVFDKYQSDNFSANISELVIIWSNAPAKPGLIKLDDVLPVVSKLIDKAESYFQTRIEKL